ncbi:MAG TPA: NYN domain-containing protein [Marmoricola sp.]|nr:NYN domain-containing protein [Marmoricola sp.]HNJ79613.1 NYN domain-containing protein [Marmoricola sp.]HNO39889.1 NYN domain-containing protein [Marmoricola sp.]
MSVLIVDGANVVGATPNGWWRDRAGAAAKLHHRLLVADTSYEQIILVLEGKAKAGIPRGVDGHLHTVHAARDGDSEILAQTKQVVSTGEQVVVITADRALQAQVEYAGARTMSPGWLLALLDS